jgi:hypothetical protein
MTGADTYIKLSGTQQFNNLTVNRTGIDAALESGDDMHIARNLTIASGASLGILNDTYVSGRITLETPPTEEYINPTGKVILCLGDSLTGAAAANGSFPDWPDPPTNYWPYYLGQLIGPGATVINRGRGGHAASDIMVHLAQDMTDTNPDIVIVMMNIDRATSSVYWTTCKNAQLAVINALLVYPNIQVVWSTMVPWGQHPYWLDAEPFRTFMNDYIRTFSTTHSRVTVADMDWAMEDPINPGHLRPAYISTDGTLIHMSRPPLLGHVSYANAIYAQLFDNIPTIGLVQNDNRMSINGNDVTPLVGYGRFDGELYLNGTAPSLTVNLGAGTGYLHTNRTTIMDTGTSITLTIAPGTEQDANISDVVLLGNDITWSVDSSQTLTFTLSGLESGRMYRLYVDGESSSLLTASRSGVVSFTYSGPWSEHQFEIIATSIGGSISGLVNLVFIMFAIGIVVGVVVEGTHSIRKNKMLSSEQMMKSLVNMVVYIVIGMAGIGILYKVVA